MEGNIDRLLVWTWIVGTGCGSMGLKHVDANLATTPFETTRTRFVADHAAAVADTSGRTVRICQGVAPQTERCLSFVDETVSMRSVTVTLPAEEATGVYARWVRQATSRHGTPVSSVVFASPVKRCVVVTHADGTSSFDDEGAVALDPIGSEAADAALAAGTLCAQARYGDPPQQAILLGPAEGGGSVRYVDYHPDPAVAEAAAAARMAKLQALQEELEALQAEIEGLPGADDPPTPAPSDPED